MFPAFSGHLMWSETPYAWWCSPQSYYSWHLMDMWSPSVLVQRHWWGRNSGHFQAGIFRLQSRHCAHQWSCWISLAGDSVSVAGSWNITWDALSASVSFFETFLVFLRVACVLAMVNVVVASQGSGRSVFQDYLELSFNRNSQEGLVKRVWVVS